jgi:hypothetical protein
MLCPPITAGKNSPPKPQRAGHLHVIPQKRPRVSTKPTKEAFDDEYFVMICLSGAEPPQIKSSPSLKLYKDYIIGEALTRFLDCIGQLLTPTSHLHRKTANVIYRKSKK